MLKRERDDIPDPLDWRGTMRTSEAFRNHNDNFTEKVSCARQLLLQYLFMEWRKAKEFLVAILVDFWTLLVNRAV